MSDEALTRIAEALERIAPALSPAPDFAAAEAFVWHVGPDRLVPVDRVSRVDLALLIGIRRRWRRARTVTVSLQVLWLVGATLDLLLAAFLARRGLELVPTLTRIVLPFALFRIMRKPQVREAFGARPSRRNRRKARRSAAGEPADRATDRLDSVEMPA